MSFQIARTAPLAELSNVRVERNGVTLLDIPSLNIVRGQNTVIFGPNGSGKSSLLKLLMKFYYPSAVSGVKPASDVAGKLGDYKDCAEHLDAPKHSVEEATSEISSPRQGVVRILGYEDWNVWDLRSHLGFVSSEIDHHFTSGRSGRLTPFQAVMTGFESGELELSPDCLTPERIERAEYWLDFFQVDRRSTKHVAWLSTGERRRVMLARAMVLSPEAILLDEPTAGLDLVASRKLLNQLSEAMNQGIQLVLVTHHLEEVLPEFQRTVMLQNGRILLDASPAAAFSSENLSKLFETPVQVDSSTMGWTAKLRG